MATIKNLGAGAQLLMAFDMFLLLWISNQCFSFESSYTDKAAGDTQSYFWIAKSVPELHKKNIPHHHAQRFVVPAVIGGSARIAGLREETGFYLTVLILSMCILYGWQRLLESSGYSSPTSLLLMGLFIFNPYALRYYLAFPGMVGDLVFVWSLINVLRSLFSGRALSLIFWTLLMALARQTAVACLPAIILGVMLLPSWNRLGSTKILYGMSLVAVVAIIYWQTGSIASQFSFPTSSWQHLWDAIRWYLFRFQWDEFLLFFTRFAITFWIPFTLLFGGLVFGNKILRSRAGRSEEIVLWVLVVGICAQPILFGPEITGGNIQRLCNLSLVGVLLLLAPWLEMTPLSQKGSGGRLAAVLLVLWASSLHHLYSLWGPQTEAAIYFVGLHVLSSLVILVLVFLPGDREPLPSS
jgi:hypothetical protein